MCHHAAGAVRMHVIIASPQCFVVIVRPVSGLARLDASPSHVVLTQWLIDAPTLAYRCGGSTGIAPVSRLTALLNTVQHLTKCANYSENVRLRLIFDDDADIEPAGLAGRGIGGHGIKRVGAGTQSVLVGAA